MYFVFHQISLTLGQHETDVATQPLQNCCLVSGQLSLEHMSLHQPMLTHVHRHTTFNLPFLRAKKSSLSPVHVGTTQAIKSQKSSHEGYGLKKIKRWFPKTHRAILTSQPCLTPAQ